MLKTPILFIIFNRPDTTQRVFDEIKKIKPEKLFIAADGARANNPDEAEKCREAREIVNQINWECEVKTLFREENLGCKKAVSSAINWFFENVEEGIILEDDCLPSQSFFWFCQEMLEYYRNDTRIMQINGSNFQNGIKRGNGSYYFSRLSHIWGWATWKRAWKLYDLEMKDFPEFKDNMLIKNIFDGPCAAKDWNKLFNKMYSGRANTWDHQWTYSVLINNGLCITPNVNLISNIGFGKNSTHAADSGYKFANLPRYEINEITHPTFIIPDKEADLLELRDNYCFGFFPKLKREILRPVRKLIK